MQGFVDDFIVFVAPVLVVVASVQRDVLLCACAQGLVAVAAMQRDMLLCACTQGLIDVAVARCNVSTARALVHIAFAI
jgi:hypothetical protein